MSGGGDPAGGDAAIAAALLALDPAGIGGVLLRGRAGPARAAWLDHLRALLPPDAPLRRLPPQIADDALLGGLDLAATLAAGRPIFARGLLAMSDRGVLLVPMAERLSAALAGRLAQAMDTGMAGETPTRIAVVALDETMTEGEGVPAALADRLGLHLDLDAVAPADLDRARPAPFALADSRLRLAAVRAEEALVDALCAAALALGIVSLRPPLVALRVAHAAAALAGRDRVAAEDAALAVRLVLAPRALVVPHEDAPPPPEPEREEPQPERATGAATLADMLVAVARAVLPPGVLAGLHSSRTPGAARQSGRGDDAQAGARRGRAVGTRPGDPREGLPLNLVETLRAAAPWQRLRQGGTPGGGLKIRREDFRLTRRRQRRETTTIFAVDASGSTALSRLGEAKGAVELLLADCYARRDRVAVIAFRGRTAQVLLPPCRALARARRDLAGLVGGGGTPLASALDALRLLAAAERRAQRTPTVVLLTDGRANVARDGAGGRAVAEAEALVAARLLAGTAALVIDTAPRPQPLARGLAAAMGGRYLPLPHASAAAIRDALRAGQ